MGQGQRPNGCNPNASHGDGVGNPSCTSKGDIWQSNPHYGMGLLRSMLEEAMETILWQKAASHRHGGGMEGG
eukprot:705257-Karenia_brevis.AAC.1